MKDLNIDIYILILYTRFTTCVRFGGKSMKKLPQISEAEFEVMRVIWEHAPISTNEVTDRLTKTTQWSPKTIQTMLKRLVTKGAISYEKESRVFIYSPLVQEDEYINQESKSFLKRYYHGDFTSMLSAFLDNHSLSEEEISSLRKLLSKEDPKEES